MMRTPLLRRLAAVALLLVLLLAVWGVIVGPVLDTIAADRESIVRSRQLLVRYDRLAAALPALERERASLRGPGAGGFLDGANPAMMAARLQSGLQRIAAAAGVALRSSQTLPPRDEDGFKRIGLVLELGAPAEGLRRLLLGVETAKPALFVEKLSVRVPENGIAPAGGDGQPVLTIRLELAAFAAKAAP